MKQITTIDAIATILAVNEMEVPVVSRDRQMPRKELAAAVRGLFRKLGIKGVSVTAPNYSMASGIDVSVPRRDDVLNAAGDYNPESEGAKMNNRTLLKVNEILARAFPRHDDRSDSHTDYFDFKFMVG